MMNTLWKKCALLGNELFISKCVEPMKLFSESSQRMKPSGREEEWAFMSVLECTGRVARHATPEPIRGPAIRLL